MKKPIVLKKYRFLIEEGATNRILALIFLYPDSEFTLSEVAEKAEASKSTASRIIKKLEEAEIVKIKDLGIIWRIKANQSNFNYIKHKIAFNLALIYSSNLAEYLIDKYKPKSIILFGSFRKAEDNQNSDIDIALELSEDIGLQIIKIPELKNLEDHFGRSISIHLFNRKNIDINLFNNIANGIILYGFLEVKP